MPKEVSDMTEADWAELKRERVAQNAARSTAQKEKARAEQAELKTRVAEAERERLVQVARSNLIAADSLKDFDRMLAKMEQKVKNKIAQNNERLAAGQDPIEGLDEAIEFVKSMKAGREEVAAIGKQTTMGAFLMSAPTGGAAAAEAGREEVVAIGKQGKGGGGKKRKSHKRSSKKRRSSHKRKSHKRKSSHKRSSHKKRKSSKKRKLKTRRRR